MAFPIVAQGNWIVPGFASLPLGEMKYPCKSLVTMGRKVFWGSDCGGTGVFSFISGVDFRVGVHREMVKTHNMSNKLVFFIFLPIKKRFSACEYWLKNFGNSLVFNTSQEIIPCLRSP